MLMEWKMFTVFQFVFNGAPVAPLRPACTVA
jgi:hypothetical protein